MIFDCTDFREALSGIKFDAESDFEVHLAVVPPKSIIENDEKLISDTEKMSDFVFVLLKFLVP